MLVALHDCLYVGIVSITHDMHVCTSRITIYLETVFFGIIKIV